MPELSPCPACGGTFPASDGPTHRYLESSPGCWAAYGEVLAREYSDPVYARLHRLTVDTYAVQHPGRPIPQTIQSAAGHLVSLCLVLERGKSAEEATQAIGAVTRNKGGYIWLDPPSSMGAVTVRDVQGAQNAEEHLSVVRRWAESTWQAWSSHHQTVRFWADEASGTSWQIGRPAKGFRLQ